MDVHPGSASVAGTPRPVAGAQERARRAWNTRSTLEVGGRRRSASHRSLSALSESEVVDPRSTSNVQGGVDVVTQSMQDATASLLARIDALEAALARARGQALTDEVTGARNRRGWQEALAGEAARCTRHGLDVVVVVADLDRFKELNDRDGHHAGDQELRRCADALRATVRTADVVARTGGDEFAVLAVHTDPAAAELLCRRIAEGLDRAGVNASIGAASSADTGSLDAAWRAADRAMLDAKAGKRSVS